VTNDGMDIFYHECAYAEDNLILDTETQKTISPMLVNQASI